MRLVVLILICWCACAGSSRVPLYYADGELVERAEKKIDFDQLEDYVKEVMSYAAHSPSGSPTPPPPLGIAHEQVRILKNKSDTYDYNTRHSFDNVTIAEAVAEIAPGEFDVSQEAALEEKKNQDLQLKISWEKTKFNAFLIFPFVISAVFVLVFVKKYGTNFDPSTFYKFK